MNVITHKRYLLEFDVWESTQKDAEKEIDNVINTIRHEMSHCGNVKLTIISEQETIN